MRSPFAMEPLQFDFEAESDFFVSEADVATPPANRSGPEFIRWVQSSLNQLNGANLAVDGVLGPLTRAAIKSFQQQQGLVVDGIVGPQTTQRIQQLLGGGNPPTPGNPSPATTDRWVLPPDLRAAGEAQNIPYDSPGAWANGANCSRTHTPGAEELRQFIIANFPGVTSVGGYYCRPNTANPSETSVHGVGRALDIMIPVRAGRADSAVGDPIANWLVGNAADIGIQYIIWNRTQWSGSRTGTKDRPYGGPNPHIDHVHAELNRAGGQRQTPWFQRNQRSNPPPAPARSTTAPTAPRPAPPAGVNYPVPAGYSVLRGGVPREVVAKAHEVLRRPDPIGTHIPIALGGRDYLFAIEWHRHAPNDKVDPGLKNWHRGVTVYVRTGNPVLPSPSPIPNPSPPSKPVSPPSATRLRFEQAVAQGHWQDAFLNLNGLNMYEMLRALEAIDRPHRDTLLGQRENFRRIVNMPRIEYAASVVETGQLPSFVPGDLASTGQVDTAAEFLRERSGGTRLAWGARVSAQFRRRVREIASSLGAEANYLMAVMAFESGETFSPSIRNRLSGATGLIQFMPSTARALGTTTEALAALTAEQQLDYVARYFAPHRRRLGSIEDVYMAVLWPKAVGASNETVLFASPSKAYEQNKGLDKNRDGRITKFEAAAFVRDKLTKGLQPGLAA